ncbi:hypothetical protein A167_02567, partial [Alcanivorax sp. S71-1-4]
MSNAKWKAAIIGSGNIGT